ncbi:polysaccharide deacetylase family protein [Candidatus Symbiobacter mobilis]|uniref:Xylanase/chitin deacetylase n=1 Tax=Candidatus Symbiobacter mobilis CR TaxID=946483 RepID=U5N4R1_9BURK|nr:polysaccharide deacetylase family protein [Candidatus Symbiobacter mobilis]AGX86476.1 xylanase/chitin deacetylase [Candidatus Symbiobacter mobilis CR]
MDIDDSSSQDRRSRRSPFLRIGLYLPLLAIMVVAGAVLIFVMTMQQIGWRVPVIGVSGAMAHFAQPGQQVVLYASPNTTRYFQRIGGNYTNLLDPWRKYFEGRNLPFDEIDDPALLQALPAGVLVLPSALALSLQEREAIEGFRSRGGGVLATWATGTRSDTGDWAGWKFLEGLGAKWVGELPAESESRHLTMNGEMPVSSQMEAGSRLWMGKTTEALLRLSGESIAGRFMNWPRILEEERKAEGAVLYSETSPSVGRAVVYAFAETSWEARPLHAHQIIDDTLRWLRREPVIVRAAWPNGVQAAHILEMDTEEGFPHAIDFAAMLRDIRGKATFYLLTSLAVQYPQVVQALAAEFEVGYHGDEHVSFRGQPATEQEQRIVRMISQLQSVLGDTSHIRGFRAPTEGYDPTTEILLQKHGIRHHAADPNRQEGRLPFIAKLEGIKPDQSLVVLARTQRDDINLGLAEQNSQRTLQALIDDFDLAQSMGALGLLSVHSQNFGPGSVLRSAMPPFLAHVQRYRDRLWLASAGEVAHWWQDRERVKLSSVYAGRRLEFDVTVRGAEPVYGLSLTLFTPEKGKMPTIVGTKVGTRLPTVRSIDPYRAALVFDQLAPGNYAFRATFAE